MSQTQSPIASTTPEALRAAIAEAVQVDAQQLQSAVGSIQVATSDQLQVTDPQIKSLYDAGSRTLTLLADRIPAGQEAQQFANALVLHLGAEAAVDLARQDLVTDVQTIKSDVYFNDAPGELGSAWFNLCTAENRLAQCLTTRPVGEVLVKDADAWFLEPQDGQLVLMHANVMDGQLSDASSRHDIHLEWVDIPEEEVREYAERVTNLVDQFAQNPSELHFARNEDGELVSNADMFEPSLKPAYTLPEAKGMDTNWNACEARGFKPSANQQFVIAAVQTALDAGKYYSKEIIEHCATALGLTPEQKAANFKRMPTEGGIFGMECYYARKYLDARRLHAEEDKAMEQLRPYVGQKLGTLMFNDFKRNTGTVVTKVDGLQLQLQYKRGTNTLACETTALTVQRAIDRAAEKNLRKDDFEAFTSSSKTITTPAVKDNGPTP